MNRSSFSEVSTFFLTVLLIVYVPFSTQQVSAENLDEIIQEQNQIRAQQKLTKSVVKKEITPVEAGKNTYESACAICHGLDGKGNGAYSNQIKQKPSDLTRLAIDRGNGVFPFVKTYAVIDGRNLVSPHGTREMPIWGDQFSYGLWLEVPSAVVETTIRGKIFELLLYLNTIQETD